MSWKILQWAIIAVMVLILSVLITIAQRDDYIQDDDHWSMVYEAIQVPELVCDDFGNCVPGDQKRFVLFNEDGLTQPQCKDLFDEHLRRLNNNGAVIEYEIQCEHLMTKGHGYLFQYQNQWLLPP